jgi:hypothetical protein
VKPSFQVLSLNANARNRTGAVAVSWPLWGAVVSTGLLLPGDTFPLMEKKRTNSGPLRESTCKHSIYT